MVALVKRSVNKRANDVKITTFVTSISAIVMERYVNERTDRRENDDFTTKCAVRAAISKIPSAE